MLVVVVWWWKVIIVSALSLSLRDKDRLRDREIERAWQKLSWNDGTCSHYCRQDNWLDSWNIVTKPQTAGIACDWLSHLALQIWFVQILISEMFKVSDPPHRKSKKIKLPLLVNIKAIFGTFIVENNLFQSYPPKCGKFQNFLTVPLLLQISVATKIENGPKMNTKILRFLKMDRRRIRRIFINSKNLRRLKILRISSKIRRFSK